MTDSLTANALDLGAVGRRKRLDPCGVGERSREIDDDVICDNASTNVDAKVLNVGLGV